MGQVDHAAPGRPLGRLDPAPALVRFGHDVEAADLDAAHHEQPEVGHEQGRHLVGGDVGAGHVEPEPPHRHVPAVGEGHDRVDHGPVLRLLVHRRHGAAAPRRGGTNYPALDGARSLEHDRPAAVDQGAVVDVGEHRSGQDRDLEVAALAPQVVDVVAVLTRMTSWSMIGPSSSTAVA